MKISKLMKFNCTEQVKAQDKSKTNDLWSFFFFLIDLWALKPGEAIARLDNQKSSGLTD